MVERDKRGRITGGRLSPETQFEEGEHWREEKPYWNEEWLRREYVRKQRSAGEIAEGFDCTAANIRHFLRKHDIKRRDISEARAVKYWGAEGEENGMYGATGEDNPNWKGGVTPERQAFYSSREWAEACQTVWDRDGASCQRCGVRRSEHKDEFHIHHIVPFSIEQLRAEPDNLVLLCDQCHQWIHSSYNEQNKFLAL
jgi:hypothetical protein